MYGIERSSKDAESPERFLARQQLSLPVLAELRVWLTQTLPVVPPQKRAGYSAVLYAQLSCVIGRKARLFSDAPAGASASAVIYSLLQTAKANDQEPYTWLRRVMRDLTANRQESRIGAFVFQTSECRLYF